ncbi:MAG: hypothetical protein ABL953_08140 [Ilumatobacteraceae bacterium]
MNQSPFDRVGALQFNRDGVMSVTLIDGRSFTARLGRPAFTETSSIFMTTYLPNSSVMQFLTTRGDLILIDLPSPSDLAPTQGRPTVYLDQNHWSTLSDAIHDPSRVKNTDELAAATAIIDRAQRREILLPLSWAHLSETCKQVDPHERYQRGVTMAQLSAGWQFADPLALRRFELVRAMKQRYQDVTLPPPTAVTLAPEASLTQRVWSPQDDDSDLPEPVRWATHVLSCICATFDVLLDAEHIPAEPTAGWASQFQKFAAFLATDPTGPEVKRVRTGAKFLADSSIEVAHAAHESGLSPSQLSEWFVQHAHSDVDQMPALRLYREVMHEKLCNPNLRWRDNDLTDMMYLTAGAAYCDHLVGEKGHVSHMRRGLARLDESDNLHTKLRDLAKVL